MFKQTYCQKSIDGLTRSLRTFDYAPNIPANLTAVMDIVIDYLALQIGAEQIYMGIIYALERLSQSQKQAVNRRRFFIDNLRPIARLRYYNTMRRTRISDLIVALAKLAGELHSQQRFCAVKFRIFLDGALTGTGYIDPPRVSSATSNISDVIAPEIEHISPQVSSPYKPNATNLTASNAITHTWDYPYPYSRLRNLGSLLLLIEAFERGATVDTRDTASHFVIFRPQDRLILIFTLTGPSSIPFENGWVSWGLRFMADVMFDLRKYQHIKVYVTVNGIDVGHLEMGIRGQTNGDRLGMSVA